MKIHIITLLLIALSCSLSYAKCTKGNCTNGQGTFVYPEDGRIYEGSWLDGKQHGKGSLTTKSGAKYVGEYKFGLENGYGTLTSPNGTFEGQFKNGHENGKGILKLSNGLTYNGTFKNGRPVNCTLTHPAGLK